MKHISIIVPNGESVLSSIIGSFKIFNKVNDYLISTGQRDSPFFEIDLVGLNNQTSLYGGLFTINPTKHIDEIKKTDLIIVTTIFGDFEKELKNNAPFVDWILNQRVNNNAEVASLCAGAFLLAETGLLDGKPCATHWAVADKFKQLYPQVNLLSEKVITDVNGIYTSGGAYSFLNLLLYIIEKYCGRETAIWCSKFFEIEFDRNNQSQFIIFNGQKDHLDEPIKNAQLFIEDNFGEKINVEALAKRFALSRRSFIRRFKKATSNTPIEYIQRVKIEAAKKQLETSPTSISDVMYTVGYIDDKSFRNIFKKITGITPMEYRKKYNRRVSTKSN